MTVAALDAYDKWCERDKTRDNADVHGLAKIAHQLATELRVALAALDEAQLRSIEARNPGIDMEQVKRTRAGTTFLDRFEKGGD